MIRNRITAILLFLLQLTGFILVGKFLYHKETIQFTDKVAKDVSVIGKDTTDKTVITFKTGCSLCHSFHVKQKVRLTDEELEEFNRTKTVKISWWHLHVKIWMFLYYILVIIGGFFALFALFDGLFSDCYSKCYSEDYYTRNRYSYRCENCPLDLRCTLYSDINKLDLKPVQTKWYKFWGYEASSNIDDSEKNS